MFDTKVNEFMNNAIEYVSPKQKTIKHSMRLNSGISCVVGISIFGFDKYCKTVFYLTEIDMIPTFKKIFQDKNQYQEKKSYYQR